MIKIFVPIKVSVSVCPASSWPSRIAISISLLLLCHLLIAQGSMRGTVADSLSGKPLPDVTLLLSDSKFGAATNEGGVYEITKIPSGSYILKISPDTHFAIYPFEKTDDCSTK